MKSHFDDETTNSRQPDVAIEWDVTARCFELSTQIVVPQRREAVFDFFSDAFQLESITPGWLNFRILTPTPIRIRVGSLIDYRIQLHGLPIRWRTEISSWEPPFSFTDRQVRGPYRLWEHFHTFEETEGGTLMRDRVCYRPPGGRLINWLLVEKDLRRIFEYRGRRMLELFPPSGSEQIGSIVGPAESI